MLSFSSLYAVFRRGALPPSKRFPHRTAATAAESTPPDRSDHKETETVVAVLVAAARETDAW